PAPVPGAPAPAPGAPPPASAPVANADAPALASRTIDLPRKNREPVWVIPALLLLAMVAAVVFVKADAIAGGKRD
ncbi:MAG: hypothetical protein J2P18_22775, partial [Nocardia sp.]|nr:hypothetical protein [Nocardia sp.]